MPVQTGEGCVGDSGWVGVSGEGLCDEVRGIKRKMVGWS
jgi:hypothetical protein